MTEGRPLSMETMIRESYQSGWYAADCDEGKVWSRPGEPPPAPFESEDEVVARLTMPQADQAERLVAAVWSLWHEQLPEWDLESTGINEHARRLAVEAIANTLGTTPDG